MLEHYLLRRRHDAQPSKPASVAICPQAVPARFAICYGNLERRRVFHGQYEGQRETEPLHLQTYDLAS